MSGTQLATVHDTYSDRTGGKSNSSIAATDVVQGLLHRFADYRSRHQRQVDVPPANASVELSRASAQRRLAVEVARLECVSGMNTEISGIVTRARDQAWHEGRDRAAVPEDRKLAKIINELFTSWVVAELNDPARQSKLAELRLDDHGRRHAVVPDLDSGATVATAEGHFTIEGLDSQNWDNVWLVPAGERTAGQRKSVPWRDLTLDPPCACPIDTLIPCGEVHRERGACVAVYQRCFAATGKNKVAATKLALAITRCATAWRAKLSLAVAGMVVSADGATTIAIGGGEPIVVLNAPRMVLQPDAAGRDVCVIQFATSVPAGGEPRCIPVLEAYLKKLAVLYQGDATTGASEPYGDDFLAAVTTMLLRYHSLSGAGADCDMNAGFHASIHPAFAAALELQFDVDTDAFANPLNTTQPRFFSLFPDTDAAFGSRGSFFDAPSVLLPSDRVAMHVNPPFETNNIIRTAETLLALLRQPGSAVAAARTFVMVIPDWTGDKLELALKSLTSAPECVVHRLLSSADASYVDGHQHRLRRPFFALESKTLLIVLQNDAAKAACGVESSAVAPAACGEVQASPQTRMSAALAAWAAASRVALSVAVDPTWNGDRKRPR